MKRRSIAALIILAAALSVTGVYVLMRTDDSDRGQTALTIAHALGEDDDSGFLRVTEPRPFTFPHDHGPHPQYKTEWWYFTGNLETSEKHHFGFQLTFFRFGLSSKQAKRASNWTTSQAYMAHFTLTDFRDGRFHSFERLSRDALGLAGAEIQPFDVWLEDWSARQIGEEALPIRLRAEEDGIAIDLTLESAKPPVLQGENGLSQKSGEPGNASYYYSMTRMPTSGTVGINNTTFEVSGLSWMDREWGTSALSEEQVGWDWFALQLSDGREVMYYQLRLRDGGIDPFSAGTLVRPDGSTRRLVREDVEIEVLDSWQSPLGGSPYPSQWRFSIPSVGLDVRIEPYIENQELDVSLRYWEGAVRVEGTSNGRPVSGSGYVELTGYADSGSGRS